MKLIINAHLVTALENASVDVAKLGNAINAAYNDGTAETERMEGVAGTKIDEKKGLFISREAGKAARTGKITDPLRFVHYNAGFETFVAKYGAPEGELSIDILPAGIRSWVSEKFGPKSAKRNGTVSVPVATVPA